MKLWLLGPVEIGLIVGLREAWLLTVLLLIMLRLLLVLLKMLLQVAMVIFML